MEKRIGFYYVFPFNKVKQNDVIVIWGMGEVGHHYLKQIEKTKYCKVLFAVDKKPVVERIGDVNVYTTDKIKSCSHEIKIVIANGNTEIVKEIKKQLSEWNIQAERVIWEDYICDSELSVRGKTETEKEVTVPRENFDFRLRVGIRLTGGIGDILIGLNYVKFFWKKFINKNIWLCLDTSKQESFMKCFLGDIDFDEITFHENRNRKFIDKYDLFICLSRYPDIVKLNMPRVALVSKKLKAYIMKCEEFKNLHPQYFKNTYFDGNSARFEIIKSRKRYCQPDIYNYLGIGNKYEYILKVDDKSLDKFGLNGRKFITVNSGTDEKHYAGAASTKLWPAEYYNTLIKSIKEKYPEYLIVLVGTDVERELGIHGWDINLLGETSLDELKALMKFSSLHIGTEGGCIHLRHALRGGVSVVLFGPTSPNYFGYEENLNLRSSSCPYPCEWVFPDWTEKCIVGDIDHRCMHGLSPQYVFNRIEKAKVV